MYFINRKAELNSFKSNYEKYRENNISQVYIIEAEHGIGKLIREQSASGQRKKQLTIF